MKIWLRLVAGMALLSAGALLMLAAGEGAAQTRARALGVTNFSLLVSHVLVPPMITAILQAPGNRAVETILNRNVRDFAGFDQPWRLLADDGAGRAGRQPPSRGAGPARCPGLRHPAETRRETRGTPCTLWVS